MSDVVTIGDATLYLGDCREILSSLEFDAIVSDPPYGIGWKYGGCGKGLQRRKFSETISGDDAPFDPAHLLAWPCALFGANHYCKRLPDGRWHAWDKSCGVGTKDDFADVEFIWTSFKRKSSMIRHLWKGILQDSEKGGQRRVHPTQKPVAVMLQVLEWLPDAQTICDPYMGSGTTGVACARIGRKFIGIEIDRKHFDTACKRINEAQRQINLDFGAPPGPVAPTTAQPQTAHHHRGEEPLRAPGKHDHAGNGVMGDLL